MPNDTRCSDSVSDLAPSSLASKLKHGDRVDGRVNAISSLGVAQLPTNCKSSGYLM